MTDLLTITGLEKRYAGFNLDAVDIRVAPGHVTGFIGSNGAGKTTTIKAALGIIRADAGTIELFGEPTTSDSARLQRMKERIGVVFDTCAFPTDATVKDIALLGRTTYAAWDQPLFDSLAAAFELNRRKRVKQLSRGMGMKLSLAFALAHHPDLLILDEVTAGMDPVAREEVLEILRSFVADGSRGILMSSHITSDLEKLADEIVCIDKGRIVFTMEKDDICDMAGIARCRAAEFEAVAQPGMRFIRREYGIDLLVADRFAFTNSHPEIPCDRAGVDDYMAITLKGETR